MIVGHRGAPLLAPENTPASFAAAAEAGAQWVELDARRCADGVVAVVHDAWLADGRTVAELAPEDLQRHGVSTLGEVWAALPPDLGVNVELKNSPLEPDYDESDRLADLVAETIAPYVGTRPLLVTSFNPSTAVACCAKLPGVPGGLVSGAQTPLAVAGSLALECKLQVACAHLDAEGLDEAGIAAAHEAGLAVMAWTVDDGERARALAACGVDALCTNDVEALVSSLPGSASRSADDA